MARFWQWIKKNWSLIAMFLGGVITAIAGTELAGGHRKTIAGLQSDIRKLAESLEQLERNNRELAIRNRNLIEAGGRNVADIERLRERNKQLEAIGNELSERLKGARNDIRELESINLGLSEDLSKFEAINHRFAGILKDIKDGKYSVEN